MTYARRAQADLPRPHVTRPVRSPVVRFVWIVAVVLLAVALVAWSTTCTGPRPRPTGDTIPTGEAPATTASTLAPSGALEG